MIRAFGYLTEMVEAKPKVCQMAEQEVRITVEGWVCGAVRLPWVRCQPLLIEPDVGISGIQLSVGIMGSLTEGIVSSAEGA